MIDVRDRREIQRAGELHGDPEGVGRRRRPVFANRQIQRLGSDIVLREIDGNARDARRQRYRDGRMVQLGGNQLLEFCHELMDTLGGQVQSVQLDRNQTLAPRVISAKYRPKRACTNLMKNPKRSERVWSR